MRPAPLGWIMANCFLGRRRLTYPFLGARLTSGPMAVDHAP